MPHYMTNENYHCLDINYKTELELKAISTYLFVFIVLSSFFYLQLNRFMTQEIRHLNRELCFIREKLKGVSNEEEGSGSGSGSGSGNGSSSGSNSGSNSGSDDDSSSSSEEEPVQSEREIRFRGRQYVMNQ